jgi:hypothetical protein
MSATEKVLAAAEVEVVAKAMRRRFTVKYKRKILHEADRCKTPGAVGALLRREGLYSSHLTTWRAARGRGVGRNAKPCGGASGRSALRPWWRSKKNSRRCWGRHWTPCAPDGDRDRGGTPARHRPDMRSAWPVAGDLLPTAAAPERPAAAPGLSPRAQCRRAGRCPLRVARATVRGLGTGRSVRHVARRGPVPLLRADDVSSAVGSSGSARAAGSAPASPQPPRRPLGVWINPPKISLPLPTAPPLPPSPLAHAGAFA